MRSEDRLVEAVAKLIELTQKREIVWKKIMDPGKYYYAYDGLVYEARYLDKNLRLFVKDQYNDSGLTLAFFDENGNLGWNFPRVAGLTDLLQAIVFAQEGVDEFLDKLIPKSKSKRNDDFEDEIPF